MGSRPVSSYLALTQFNPLSLPACLPEFRRLCRTVTTEAQQALRVLAFQWALQPLPQLQRVGRVGRTSTCIAQGDTADTRKKDTTEKEIKKLTCRAVVCGLRGVYVTFTQQPCVSPGASGRDCNQLTIFQKHRAKRIMKHLVSSTKERRVYGH